jgi:hypothetical protein
MEGRVDTLGREPLARLGEPQQPELIRLAEQFAGVEEGSATEYKPALPASVWAGELKNEGPEEFPCPRIGTSQAPLKSANSLLPV